jgi:hypothetical protein
MAILQASKEKFIYRVKQRFTPFIFFAVSITLVLFFGACKKINEATDVGEGLIPPVDNINTFDTTVDVFAFNDTFRFADDSIYYARTETQWLGLINADPFFGKTDARMFFELKPFLSTPAYPFARRDSVKIDSIVLVLDYKETYGDSTVPQTFNVYEINPGADFDPDSSYLIRQEPFSYSNILSQPGQLFYPKDLDDSVKAFRDTTKNQLRIKLDTTLARRFFNYDTTNAYKSDSLFKVNFEGFVVRSMTSGNAVMGFTLGNTNTKLAFYYNHPKVGGGGRDTTVTYFYFTTSSAAANYVKRDYMGSPVELAVGGTNPDPFVYIQNTPGTYATLKIPALATMSNRVVHRAELIMEQVYHPLDTFFRVPDFLFLDVYDSAISKYRTVPYDFQFSNSGTPNYSSFGMIPMSAADLAGNRVSIWKFNISRYVQNTVNKSLSLYNFRLYAPYVGRSIYGIPPAAITLPAFLINPTIVKGRVRLAGNTGPGDTNPRRLRLRIIYSKL